jgi:hypothetical protein
MNRTGAKVVGVLVAGLLVGATACGGSSKSDESSSSDKVTATTAGNSNGNSDLSQLGDDLNALKGKTGDCFAASLAFAALAITPLGFMGGATQDQIDQLKSDTEELKAEVPSAVKDDFQTYADGIEQYANALKGVSLTDIMNPETQQKMQDASKILDSPEMKAASDNIEKYFSETCPSGN